MIRSQSGSEFGNLSPQVSEIQAHLVFGEEKLIIESIVMQRTRKMMWN